MFFKETKILTAEHSTFSTYFMYVNLLPVCMYVCMYVCACLYVCVSVYLEVRGQHARIGSFPYTMFVQGIKLRLVL